MRFAVFFVLFQLVFLTPCVLSQENSPKLDREFEVERETTLFQSETGDWGIRCNIGSVPVGKRGVVYLQVFNPTDRTISIQTFRTSCKCLKAGSASNTIPAMGSIELDLTLQVPPESKTRQYRMSLMLLSKDGEEIPIELQAELAGLACFSGSAYVTHVATSQNSHTFQIPIIITDPTKIQDLKVECHESLGTLQSRIVSNKDGDFVECKLVGTPESATGEVILTNSATGKKSIITCIIRSRAPFEVSPQLFRLTQDESNPHKYSGSVLLKLDRDTLAVESAGEIESPPLVEWWSEAGELSQEQIRLAQGIYKVKLQLEKKPKASDKEIKIVADYKFKNGSYRKEFDVLLHSKTKSIVEAKKE